VFKISVVSGKPVARIVHSFTNAGGDGAYPQSALILDAAENIYGTTQVGGGRGDCQVEQEQGGCGMAFKLSPVGNQWKQSLLHSFTSFGDGAFPSGLVMDGNGNLYGGSFIGGAANQGLVFEIVP